MLSQNSLNNVNQNAKSNVKTFFLVSPPSTMSDSSSEDEELASLESMAVFGKIFRVHAKFCRRDWRADANFGVHNLSNPPHAVCSSCISVLSAYKRGHISFKNCRGVLAGLLDLTYPVQLGVQRLVLGVHGPGSQKNFCVHWTHSPDWGVGSDDPCCITRGTQKAHKSKKKATHLGARTLPAT